MTSMSLSLLNSRQRLGHADRVARPPSAAGAAKAMRGRTGEQVVDVEIEVARREAHQVFL